MSQYDDVMNKKAVALRYDENKDVAPVIVASGLGYMAERIVEMANENGVPVYEDNSLATVLTQLDLGTAIPEELYQAIVDIYAYFLKYNPQKIKEAEEEAKEAERRAREEAAAKEDEDEGEGEEAAESGAVNEAGAPAAGEAGVKKPAKPAARAAARPNGQARAAARPNGQARAAARPNEQARQPKAAAKPTGQAAGRRQR